jgi:hypothetical protein
MAHVVARKINFRVARLPGAIAIISHKPTFLGTNLSEELESDYFRIAENHSKKQPFRDHLPWHRRAPSSSPGIYANSLTTMLYLKLSGSSGSKRPSAVSACGYMK